MDWLEADMNGTALVSLHVIPVLKNGAPQERIKERVSHMGLYGGRLVSQASPCARRVAM